MEGSECLLNDDKDSECLLNDTNEALMQQNENNCSEPNGLTAKHEGGCKFCGESFAAFEEDKQSQRYDKVVADKREILKDNN